jgi:hypothetical protein
MIGAVYEMIGAVYDLTATLLPIQRRPACMKVVLVTLKECFITQGDARKVNAGTMKFFKRPWTLGFDERDKSARLWRGANKAVFVERAT